MKQYNSDLSAEQIAGMADNVHTIMLSKKRQIVSTPQSGAMCVGREGLLSAEYFLAEEATA